MTFDVYFRNLSNSNSHTSRNLACIDYSMFTHELESTCRSNFNCLLETERFLNVTGSHMHCKFGSILEAVHDKHCCYYRPLI